MSWDYNPYQHIELIEEGFGWKWICYSCGAEMKLKPTDSLITLKLDWFKHIKESHGQGKRDFKGWSKR